MKREVKLNPILRRCHSITKTDTDKGKDKKINEIPPFMPALSFVCRDKLLEPHSR